MREFSHKNHIRFGWGKGIYNFDDQSSPVWYSFGRCEREPLPFKEEVNATSRLIAEKFAGRQLYIGLSGGLDSEVIARSFLELGIPFTAITIRYIRDWNMHDISYAIDFCQKNNVPQHVLDMNPNLLVLDNLEIDYIVDALQTLQQMILMRTVAAMGGVCILGVGEQRYFFHNNELCTFQFLSKRMAKFEILEREQFDAVPMFFSYTPEIMYSILTESKKVGFDNMTDASHNIKEHVYRSHYPLLTERPKFNGFEKIRFPTNVYKKVMQNIRYPGKFWTYHIPIALLEEQLKPHG